MFLASGCSSVASHGKGGWGDVAPGLLMRGGATLGWEQQGVGMMGAILAGGQQWGGEGGGGLQPLRTDLNTISLSISLKHSLS